MNPVPCSYCGINFMRKFEEDRTCNNCALRFSSLPNITNSENLREDTTVKVQIDIPDRIYKKIEEHCLNYGTSLSNYFIQLSHLSFFVEKDPRRVLSIDKSIIEKTSTEEFKNGETPDCKKLNRSLKTQRKREKKIDK